MTPKQRELARHALGLPNDDKRSYRNRYIISKLGVRHAAWEDMRRQGYALAERDATSYGDLFYLTPKGARAALEAGETLCPEDFPALSASDARPEAWKGYK